MFDNYPTRKILTLVSGSCDSKSPSRLHNRFQVVDVIQLSPSRLVSGRN